MTYHRHTLLGDDPHRLQTLLAWLREWFAAHGDKDAAELADAIDAGLDGETLELSELHWRMLGNWSEIAFAQLVKAGQGDKARPLWKLLHTVTAAVKSEPVRTVDDGKPVQVAEPAGATQGSLFD